MRAALVTIPFVLLRAVGTGCPDSTSFAFGCRGWSDDALTDLCTPGASRVTVNATQSRLYVLVQGWANAAGAYTINMRYLAPSASPSPSQVPPNLLLDDPLLVVVDCWFLYLVA